MGFRSYLATAALNAARSFGNALGCELMVETSDHSLHTKMTVPDTTTKAWNPNLWKRGQLFVRGYANPVKPYVERHIDQGDQDKVNVVSAELEDEEDHVSIVSDTMYRMYQDQHLASELMLPAEKWKRIFYALLAVGGLVVLTLGLNLAAFANTGGI